jgi:hypothetical protein
MSLHRSDGSRESDPVLLPCLTLVSPSCHPRLTLASSSLPQISRKRGLRADGEMSERKQNCCWSPLALSYPPPFSMDNNLLFSRLSYAGGWICYLEQSVRVFLSLLASHPLSHLLSPLAQRELSSVAAGQWFEIFIPILHGSRHPLWD